jgi:hypothetical protein
MEVANPTGFYDILKPFGAIASKLISYWRPDLLERLASIPSDEFYFGLFHLFVSTQGVAKMHKDRNDYVSFLFPISTDKNSGGGLEIGGTGQVYCWQVCDCIILDSAQLPHGTHDYLGDPKKLVIGILIHKTFLMCNGL